MTDFLAFLVIVLFATKPGFVGFKMSRLLRTIIRDATVYFLLIFTSHFVFEMTLLLARVSTFIGGGGSLIEDSVSQIYNSCRVGE